MSTPPPRPPRAPAPVTTSGKPMFFAPDAAVWKELKADVPAGTDPTEEQKILAAAKVAKDELKTFLLSSLQMQHVVVLAGSGTSLGPITKGPSMWNLWDYCVNANPGTGTTVRTVKPEAAKVIADIGYDVALEKENIEALLSRCEAFLQSKGECRSGCLHHCLQEGDSRKVFRVHRPGGCEPIGSTSDVSTPSFSSARSRFTAQALHDELRSML